MKMSCSPACKLDGYKFGHRDQFPEGMELMFANMTARFSRVDGVNHIVWFGLQYFIKEYLIEDWNTNFFQLNKDQAVAIYERRYKNYMRKEKVPVEYIEDLHDLGYLPIKIMGLPEGASVPIGVPPIVIWNTHKNFAWLANSIETLLSDTVWLPCTSATTAKMYRELLDGWAEKTGTDPSFVDFQGHDFSMRGHGSFESACTSGAAHLLSFAGTDTVPAVDFLEHYYNADSDTELVGTSVNATEHAVMCAGSDFTEKGGDDFKIIKRLITEVYSDGVISIVCDTFDFWEVVRPNGGTLDLLKKEIMDRDGTVVIRPDSGDPVDIVCGKEIFQLDTVDPQEILKKTYDLRNEQKGTGILTVYTECKGKFSKFVIQTQHTISKDYVFAGEDIEYKDIPAEYKGLIQCLWDTFGGTVNAKGFKELDSHIGAIYGDSITLARADAICKKLAAKGFASGNIVFGIGSFTYQGAITPNAIVTRDTYGFAIKATYAEINGKPKELYKDPKTDNGVKKSARGLLAVFKDSNGEYYLKESATWYDVRNCEYILRFCDSQIYNEQSFKDIKLR